MAGRLKQRDADTGAIADAHPHNDHHLLNPKEPNTGHRQAEQQKTSHGQSGQKQHFLDALAAGASVRAATEALGIKPDAPYRWRENDTDFAMRWRHAEEAGTDLIEEEAYRRAVTGVEKPVYRGGEVVGHVADFSDTMLMFLLKARRPDRYGAKAGDNTLDAQALAKRLNLKGARDALHTKFAQITTGR